MEAAAATGGALGAGGHLVDGLDRSRARWNVLGQQVFFSQYDYIPGDVDMVTGFKQGKYEKRIVSKIYNGLSRKLFQLPVRDLNSVKAYRREVMDSIPIRPDWHRYMIAVAAA